MAGSKSLHSFSFTFSVCMTQKKKRTKKDERKQERKMKETQYRDFLVERTLFCVYV